MTDAVGGEETPPEGHAPKVKDCYRPTYSSDTYPRFPQELIDRICEFLQYDPFTLTRCRLVCHAWYHAAQHIFWPIYLKLSTREAWDDCAHMLLSNDNRPYGKKFASLSITEDPRKPFIRVFPMRIPGYFLPQVTSLEIVDFDCAVTRPHDLFFRFLSYYTSITRLEITRCCFRSIAEVRRISNALPSLEQLVLHSGITLQHPLALNSVARSAPSVRNKLKEIVLTISDSTSESAAHFDEHHQLLSDVCVTYSSSYVTKLWLGLRYCSSLSHLHQSLCCFSHLSCLTLRGAFSSHVGPASVADMALYTARAPNPSLSDFELIVVPASWAAQLLKLVLTPQACSKLGALRLHIFAQNGQCAELGPCVTEVLRLSGAGLKKFEWCYDGERAHDLIHDVLPRLTANTFLTNLRMHFHWVNPSLSTIQSGLGTLLSDIRSPHLEHFTILISLSSKTSEDGDEASLSETDPPGSTSAFHTILSRSIFDQHSRVSRHPSVYIFISMGRSKPQGEAQTATMSAIKSHMITLFAPWLDRGVLWLRFNPDPDGKIFITRNPSSVLSGHGTHARITEIQDSEDGEREGGARDTSEDTETGDAISPQPTARVEERD